MKDIKFINKKISDILKNDYNEVVYKVWLFLTESAELDENDIVINAPNYYIKETMEDRYASEIEELYRNELKFSKFIIRVS
jgi:chromosomal replication initiation ATPase DnaA